jgi:hypothetical protein
MLAQLLDLLSVIAILCGWVPVYESFCIPCGRSQDNGFEVIVAEERLIGWQLCNSD